MTQAPQDPRLTHTEAQLADLDLEIIRQAMLCGIRLDSRPQIRADMERVLNNDASVCTKPNPVAFAKLRAAATMHMTVRDRAIENLGRAQTMEIVDQVAERLAKRLGIKVEPGPSG